MKKELRAGIIFSYITILLQFITSILYTPFMLDKMGQQQYGLYNMGASIIGYLSLAELGFGNAIVKFVARYRAKEDPNEVRRLCGLFQWIYLILASFVLVVGVALAFLSGSIFKVTTGAQGYKELKVIILILVFNLAFSFSTVTYSSIINAYEKFSFAKITNIFYILLKPAVMIPLLIWGYKAVAMSLVTLALTMLLHIGNILYVRFGLKLKFIMRKKLLDFSVIKEILSYSGLVFVAMLAATLINSTDQVILGITSGEFVVAEYAIAFTIIGIAQQFPGTITGVFFPRINVEIAQGASMKQMSDRMISVGRLQFLIIALIYGGFIIFGQEFMWLWAGSEYKIAYWIVLAVLIPASVSHIQPLGVQIIQATNKYSFKVKMEIICAVINIAFSIPAAIYFGALGCAVVTGVSMLITRGFIMNWYYEKKVGLEIGRFWLQILKMFLVLMPLLAGAYVANIFIRTTSWLVLVGKIFAFVALYFPLSYFGVMNKSEKGIVGGFAKKLFPCKKISKVVKSLQARVCGKINDYKSHYGQYAKYYEKLPVNDKAILFESFGGKNFQGNVFYVYKWIYESQKFEGIDLIVSAKDESCIKEYLANRNLFDERVRFVCPNTKAYRKALATSKYLVNNVSFTMNFIKKPEQVYLNTWHGTPLKSLGKRVAGDPFEMLNAQRNFLLSDYLIAPNEFTKNVFLYDHCITDIMPGQILLQGYPRNAVFFDENARNEIKEKYNLHECKTILYMPTWRGNASGVEDIDVFDNMETLAESLGNEYKIFVKLHPAMVGSDRVLTNINYAPTDCEIYEFLNGVDILITDYSSVMFDFANTGKPIILYQYDKESYFNSRGAYTEVLEKLPFDVAQNLENLTELVTTAQPKDYGEFINEFCAYDGIDGAQNVAELLFAKTRSNNGKPVDLYVIDRPITNEQLLALVDDLGDEKPYLFAFLANKKNKVSKFTCLNKLNYTMLYNSNRLRFGERLKFNFARFGYKMTRAKYFKRTIERYVLREQRRLFGDVKIDNIFVAGKTRKQIAIKFAKKWEI